MTTVPVCDFCRAPEPRWEYRCEPFVVTESLGREYWDDGMWAACDTCRVVVDLGRVDQLLGHVVLVNERLGLIRSVDREDFANWFRPVVEGFLATARLLGPLTTELPLCYGCKEPLVGSWSAPMRVNDPDEGWVSVLFHDPVDKPCWNEWKANHDGR